MKDFIGHQQRSREAVLQPSDRKITNMHPRVVRRFIWGLRVKRGRRFHGFLNDLRRWHFSVLRLIKSWDKDGKLHFSAGRFRTWEQVLQRLLLVPLCQTENPHTENRDHHSWPEQECWTAVGLPLSPERLVTPQGHVIGAFSVMETSLKGTATSRSQQSRFNVAVL